MRPLLMPPNIIDHFYQGGQRLATLRGVDLPSPRRPEEWLAATVHRAGEPDTGLSRLADGSPFAALVAADPVGWTGSPHGGPGAGPADTGVLVKFLDAGQRLPVHVHPTRAFATEHLHSCYGKTEAWYVLDVEGEDPSVWVGFAADVDPDELSARVEAQDSAWMLAQMNKISVRPGDGILVPAGEPHATGAGVFVVEVQEPTDFSILLEWSATTATRDESHLGLGFDVVLPAVNHRGSDPATVDSWRHHHDPGARHTDLLRALPSAADPYFRVDLANPTDGGHVRVPHGFAVAIVVDGHGELGWTDGSQTEPSQTEPLQAGQVYAIPDGIGDWTVTGDVQIAVCRPSADWPTVPQET